MFVVYLVETHTFQFGRLCHISLTNRFGSKMLTEYQNFLIVQVLARYCKLSSHVFSHRQVGLVASLGKIAGRGDVRFFNMLFLLEMGIVQSSLSGTEPRFLEHFHKDKVLEVYIYASLPVKYFMPFFIFYFHYLLYWSLDHCCPTSSE